MAQLGRSLEAYFTTHSGTYVPESSTFINNLVGSGELSTVPSAIAYGVTGITGCTGAAGGEQNGWCYDATDVDGAEPAVLYTVLESNSDRSKCTSGEAYFVWSTADGRAGLVCSASEPAPGAQTWNATQ